MKHGASLLNALSKLAPKLQMNLKTTYYSLALKLHTEPINVLGLFQPLLKASDLVNTQIFYTSLMVTTQDP